MSRSIVIIVRAISFCVLANVVCGSQYYYRSNGRTRNPRYASCPSCHRDCPDALSSPWYSRENYGEISASRNYQSFNGGSYGRIDTRDEYGRSPRSGGVNPTDVTASRTSNSYQYSREDFEDRQLQRIDPHLASKPSTSMLSQGNAFNPYPFKTTTNSLISSNYEREKAYQPRKFVHEYADRSANFENTREYNVDRSSGLNENPYRDKLIEPSSVRKDVEEGYPKVSQEKYLVVYRADRADRAADRAEERLDGEEEEEGTLVLERSDFTDAFKESKIASGLKDIDGPFAGIDLHSFLVREHPTRNEKLVVSRKPFATSNLIQEPEIKRNPYNLSPRSNFAKMMQNVRDINRNENSVPLWQNDRESVEEEIDKSLESLTRDTDYYVYPIDGEFVNESTKTIRNDAVPNNEEEKLLDEEAIKITETKSDAIEEDSLKFDPDSIEDIEDIENPPVEPTEPSPMNEPTESSTTEKHSR